MQAKPLLSWRKGDVGLSRGYTDHHQCRGHPWGRQPHSLIFMSTLYNALSGLPAKQLTNDHEPACMCHLYRLRINTHVLSKHHALLYRATAFTSRFTILLHLGHEQIHLYLCKSFNKRILFFIFNQRKSKGSNFLKVFWRNIFAYFCLQWMNI